MEIELRKVPYGIEIEDPSFQDRIEKMMDHLDELKIKNYDVPDMMECRDGKKYIITYIFIDDEIPYSKRYLLNIWNNIE